MDTLSNAYNSTEVGPSIASKLGSSYDQVIYCSTRVTGFCIVLPVGKEFPYLAKIG